MEDTSWGLGNILTFEKENDISEIMTVESFLFLTKHGKRLSIIDGYVIDIGNFIVSGDSGCHSNTAKSLTFCSNVLLPSF